jgi:protein-arginine kinase activator protein McsA
MPQNIDGPREVVRLRRMLSELVDRERFEEAAGVRDRLAELGAGPTGGHAAAAAGRTARDVPGSGE